MLVVLASGQRSEWFHKFSRFACEGHAHVLGRVQLFPFPLIHECRLKLERCVDVHLVHEIQPTVLFATRNPQECAD